MSVWRNTTFFEKAPESPNERFGIGSSSMSRDMDIPNGSFASRIQAAYDFLGYAVVLNNGTGSFVHRVIPMAYPGLPNSQFLPAVPNDLPAGTYPPQILRRFYALAISRTQYPSPPTGVNPVAQPTGSAAAQYQRARLSIEFTTVPYQILDDPTLIANGGVLNGNPDEGIALQNFGWPFTRYITRQKQAFSRLLKIPYGVMQTAAPGINGQPKLTKQALPFREGGANIAYTWMRVPLEGPVPGANFARIGSMLQLINPVAFDGHPAQTLLFDSYSTREYQGAFGEWLADITFNMIFLPHNSSGNNFGTKGNKKGLPAGTATGWNTVVDVDANGNWDYYSASTAGGGQPPFQTAAVLSPPNNDFSALFRP